MRLGILEIGGDGNLSSLCEALRRQDIDVIVNEEPVTTVALALREGARLGRADCDSVLLVVSAPETEHLILPAVMHLACPLLLQGAQTALTLAAEELQSQRLQFEITDGALFPDVLVQWLKRNRKSERQPGIEAAFKLYGQRISLPPAALADFDRRRWFGQFGIVAVSLAEEAEIHAENGDALTALTVHLLRLISGTEPMVLPGDTVLPSESTILQFHSTDRGFACSLALLADGIPTVTAFSGLPVAVPGDCCVAIAAACFHLSIETSLPA